MDKVDGDCLRMRSRKASLSDCIHFLKPGVEVCVLSRHPVSANFGQEVQKPVSHVISFICLFISTLV